ncbi:MAG: hypothetical protein IKQ06_05945 [Bacilli bacterium]|nr:hypothetical protein [Bacilli bacterium]MBR6137679.1 hypothetical protein [Bacilli bacterium]
MYNQYPVNYGNPEDERFLLAPFLLGGVAGTALGYGISQNNNQQQYYPVPVYPVYPYPQCPNCNNNNYYYY